jgi:hypothetical protein
MIGFFSVLIDKIAWLSAISDQDCAGFSALITVETLFLAGRPGRS